MSKRDEISKKSRNLAKKRKQQLEEANPNYAFDVVQRGDVSGVRFLGKKEVEKIKEGWGGKLPGRGGSGGGGISTIGGRRSAPANDQQRSQDEISSLSYFQYENLDRGQVYANAGDTLPVVFCRRENNAGGVWVSLPLLDLGSLNFERTFIYALSQGQASPSLSTSKIFVGKDCISDISSSVYLITVAYSNNSAVCPISSFDITCDHSNFYAAIDSLSTSANSEVVFRTVDKYTTGFTVRAKPIHEPGNSGAFTTYDLTVKRYTLSGLAGPVTTVGTMTTSSAGLITSVTDSPSADSYVYVIENNGVNTTGVDPETILLEIQQNNTFPSSYDRTSSYTGITLLVVEGNVYDIRRAYSDPSNLKQLHVFCQDGISVDKWRKNPGGLGYLYSFGPSNKFADLVNWYTENSGNFPNAGTYQTTALVSVAQAAAFHDQYNMTYNGVISNTTNFLSWAQQISPMFLLGFYSWGDLYIMPTLIPTNDDGTINTNPLVPKESFDDTEAGIDRIANAIISGSYSKTYIETAKRKPFQVLVSWRSQNEYNMETSQTTSVRYSDYGENVPEETYDMTAFASNADHATIFAKYLLATRRYSTHTISFKTPRNVTTSSFLEPYDIISLTLNRINSQGDSTVETDYYLVTSLSFDSDGIVSIEAEHFPVDANGASIITNSIVSGSFEVVT